MIRFEEPMLNSKMIAPSNAGETWNRTRASHARLSPEDVQFRERAQQDEEFLRRERFRVPELEPLSVFPRQPWPLFAAPSFMREMSDAAVAVSRLVRSIPERLFQNDAERMAPFYGMEPVPLKSILAPPNGIAEALSRVDLLHGASGFQCAEINVGGNIGGLENCVLAEMAFRAPAIRSFIAGLGRQVTHPDSFALLARHVVRQVQAAGLSNGEINVALVLRADEPAPANVTDFFCREYRSYLAGLASPLGGRLIPCTCDSLAARDGRLFSDGSRVHALIEGGSVRIPFHIYRCAKLGNLLLFNGPISIPLSDKRNLALLSEHSGSDAFTPEERNAIERYVPWTRRLLPVIATRHGERGDLESLALARREELVLKKARSLGGADVILGRDTAPAEWRHAVAQGLLSKDWIVQDFVPSLPYLFQHGENGCCAHTVVWGPFVFGTEFGGTYMRVLPEAAGGIVNVTRGGSSAVLLEVEDPGAPVPR